MNGCYQDGTLIERRAETGRKAVGCKWAVCRQSRCDHNFQKADVQGMLKCAAGCHSTPTARELLESFSTQNLHIGNVHDNAIVS